MLRIYYSQINFEKEGQHLGLTPPNFKIYYKATITKLVSLGIKIDKQNQSSESDSYLSGQLIFDRGVPNSMEK